jgi:WD40 repeat protein
MLATGGADGSARLWSYPDLQETFEGLVNKKGLEVADVDVSNDGVVAAACGALVKLFVTVAEKGTRGGESGSTTLVW